MDRKDLWKIFSLAYCNTCHSEQGCSIDDDITIFDSNTPYVDRYWMYTAITRCRELDQVTIYIHSPKELRQLKESKKKQYIKHKIDGYRDQDKQAGRKIDKKNYVDWDWFDEEYYKNKTCYHCNCCFEMDLDENNKVFSNITFDRIDDSICHSKGNLLLSCLDCNRKKIKY